MNPLLVILLGQTLDIVVRAILKDPKGEATPSLAPILSTVNAALSQAVGETAEETAKRRTDAEAIFAKHGGSLLPAPEPPPSPFVPSVGLPK